jgi:hypothetical protein
MIELTEEQRRLLGSEPLVRDPETNETYVLVRAEEYARLKAAQGEAVLATAEMVDAIMAEDDAKDPYLEEYQKLYGKRP